MIHEELATYGIARLAKEAGFPQDPNHNDHSQIYCWDGLRNLHSLCKWEMWYSGEYNNEDMYAAPTQSLLQRWLREEKGVYIDIGVDIDHDLHRVCFKYGICYDFDRRTMEYHNCYDSFRRYELALEDALKYALENLV